MNKLIQNRLALLTLPLAMVLGACDDDDDPMAIDEPANIVMTAADAGSFGTLLTALDVANLTSALEGMGPFTVFAPTDAAFADVDPEVLTDLLADTELLAAVLTYHVVPGRFTAADVAGLTSAPTLNGKAVPLSFDGTTVTVDGATVISADIEASNGIIHVIDRVILPEPIADIVVGVVDRAIRAAQGNTVAVVVVAVIHSAG